MSRPVSNTNVLATAVQFGQSRRATKLTALNVVNTAAAVTYIQMFDASVPTDVTVGTTVPDMALGLVASGSLDWSGIDLMFGKGLVIAATTTPTGSTPPATGAVVNAAVDDG